MNKVKQQFHSSSSELIYTAIIDVDSGASSCNCKGWTFKRKNQPRDCKHTKEMRQKYGYALELVHVGGENWIATKKGVKPVPVKPKTPVAVKPVAVAPKPTVTPEQFAKAQAEVESAVAMVKGKRKIEVDDDDDPPAPVKAGPAPKVIMPPEVAAAVVAAFAPAKPKAESLAVAPAIKPMLASAMAEGQTIADFANADWILEEKFDGHRLMLVVEPGGVTGWSRPGQDRPAAMRPLPNKMADEAKLLPVGTYDGELYVPGGMSSDVARLDKIDELRLVLFDVLNLSVLGPHADVHDRPFSERRKLLELALSPLPKGTRIHIAEQRPVSLAAVQAIWAAKGEGAILKRLDATYRSGWRTPAWVKVKKIAAAELIVTGFEAGKNGPYSAIALRHDDGRTTTVKTLTQELLRSIEKDPKAYIGRRVVISYMGLTPSGKWRHPQLDHFLEAA